MEYVQQMTKRLSDTAYDKRPRFKQSMMKLYRAYVRGNKDLNLKTTPRAGNYKCSARLPGVDGDALYRREELLLPSAPFALPHELPALTAPPALRANVQTVSDCTPDKLANNSNSRYF
eukprot:6207694-Pleurochrysis_carterae.AAC.4